MAQMGPGLRREDEEAKPQVFPNIAVERVEFE